MRILIATTAILAWAGLIGFWLATRRGRRSLVAVGAVVLVLSAALIVGMIGFPREACELMGGNLTGYDSGDCVNELGGTTVGGIR